MTLEFEQLLSKFRKRRVTIGESAESTADRYVRHVRSWRDWLLENREKSLWNAETKDLRIYAEDLSYEDMAASTISQRVSAISKFYQDMGKMADRYDIPNVPPNPYDGFDREDKQLMRGDSKKKAGLAEQDGDSYPYLEPDKVQDLVDNVPSPRRRNELIVKLLFNCGFRRGELAQLKIKHINREERSIYIPPMKSKNTRTVTYKWDYLGRELDHWLDHGGRDSATHAYDSEYLFPTNDREYISVRAINHVIKKAATSAGLQETLGEYSDGREIHKVTAHTLRHSYAMQALDSGINIRTLQSLLGHSEIDTTMVYLQQSNEDAKEKSRDFNPRG